MVPVSLSDECGIVAQISQPLADSDISAYYISTFSFDHALVSPQLHAPVWACLHRVHVNFHVSPFLLQVPEEDISRVTAMLQHQKTEPDAS